MNFNNFLFEDLLSILIVDTEDSLQGLVIVT